MRTKLAAFLLAAAVTLPAAADTGALLQLVDYIGVDYGGAVEGGVVVNDFEYAEMVEFARLAGQRVAALPASPQKGSLAAEAQQLADLVARKAPPAEVAALTHRMRDGLMRAYPRVLTPRALPDLARGARVYQKQCASCHGVEGRGDGPSAPTLDPPPIDFHDAARARQRSVYGLYSAITLGVQGTGMASFSHLSDADRWALAFYVGGMYADPATLAAGEAAFRDSGEAPSLREVVTQTPNELGREPAGAALAAWARHHPDTLFAATADPIDIALERLGDSVAAYEAGRHAEAGTLAVAAYLDGFELAEASLTTVAPDLVQTLEGQMLGYRALINAGEPAERIGARAGEIATLLERAREARDGEPLSGAMAFTSSLVILLREGLEAILLLGAIVAVLVRTGRREALAWVHFGWIAALAAGLITWVVATWMLAISGATRELTEGVTALLAAAILFYVGFWMHDKVHAQRWNAFLKEKVQQALNERTLAGIALVSFLAVYREVFETVLFYQALWAQVAADGKSALVAGAATAAVTLTVLAWAVFTFGLKVPLRQFFAASAAVMFLLAIIFVGKGVVALQEAGRLPISPIEFPRIELLGVYPTLQSLAAQLVLVLAALALVWWNGRSVRAVAAS